MSMRRLCLGSVSSLSFEEEENGDHFLADHGGESSSSLHDPHLQHDGHGHELHELLTDRLEEQVDALLRLSSSPSAAAVAADSADLAGRPSTPGLHQALNRAVHDILHMSEEEPYGVRGATIILKWRSVKGDEEKYLGAIAVDTSTVSTFRLILVLQEERRLGVVFRNWLGQFTGRRQAHVISPQYTLLKEKLYRSPSGGTMANFRF